MKDTKADFFREIFFPKNWSFSERSISIAKQPQTLGAQGFFRGLSSTNQTEMTSECSSQHNFLTFYAKKLTIRYQNFEIFTE